MSGQSLLRFHRRQSRPWAPSLASGKLKSREDVVQGLETFPDTFLKLFDGSNNGKLVLQVHA